MFHEWFFFQAEKQGYFFTACQNFFCKGFYSSCFINLFSHPRKPRLGFNNIFCLKSQIEEHEIHQLGSAANSAYISCYLTESATLPSSWILSNSIQDCIWVLLIHVISSVLLISFVFLFKILSAHIIAFVIKKSVFRILTKVFIFFLLKKQKQL